MGFQSMAVRCFVSLFEVLSWALHKGWVEVYGVVLLILQYFEDFA